jgi:predicted NUDIX family NTP pyrophosphohydrolase
LLLYRRHPSLEVFLVHPGGPLGRRRDLGAWSIPKGELGEGEDPFVAAQREFAEETGHAPAGDFVDLGEVVQQSGKHVRAWAVEGALDPARLRSNTFSLMWPPRSGRFIEVPEVDRGEWFDLAEARRRILPAQAALLDRLQERLIPEAEGRVDSPPGGA